jgi:hypothetical protein
MVVLVVNVRDVWSLESERHPPIAAHADGPRAEPRAFQRMEPEPGESHISWLHCHTQSSENQSEAGLMLALNSGSRACAEETPQALVTEPDDRHSKV